MSGSHPHGEAMPETQRPSLIGRLDPRTRVVGAVLFTLSAVVAETPSALAAALLLAGLLALLARLPLAVTARRLLALEGFMLVVLASLPFSIPGATLVELFGQPASAEGVARALAIAAKANAVALAMLALLGSMETTALGHALGRLGLPERFVALFLLTTRYVEVLHQEYARLRLAMRARGFRMTSSAHTWRSMGWLVGMLLVMSLERSERIHAAMRLRGFTGRFHLAEATRAGALDWGFGAAQLASLVLMFALDLP